jgi:hypothetical protein
MRRRLTWAALAIVGVLVGYPGYLIARAKFFPKQYEVTSITLLREYQDPALLDRAWSLPVASRYGRFVESQRNVSVCGPTSVANMFRSLGSGPTNAAEVLQDTGRCRLFGYCWNGLTLSELADVVRTKTTRRVTVIRDLTLAEFRDHMRRSNELSRRYLVNFHRGLLFGRGGGHHSPIGGYLPDEDLVFVLDVNGSFGPWLVPSERLYRAMDTVDGESHRKRGLLLLE